MKPKKDAHYPILTFETHEDFEQWLFLNHNTTPGIWLKFAKKGTGVTTINYAIALDVSLCFGWIDGQSKKLDETYYLQKFTPRGKRSIWSKINRGHVARLIKENKMKPAGLLQIEAAKKDGRWEAAYDSPTDMKVPDDFLALLKSHPKAYTFFLTLNKTNLYSIAWRLQTAKKPETRAKRMAQFIEMMKKSQKFY